MDGAIVQNNMTKLNEWRKADINCDVTLSIDGQEFHAHKIILAAAIEYFEKLFTGDFAEKEKNAITLNDVDPDGFGLILNYIYTGEIKIDDDIFGQVLPLAAYYQIECLIEELFRYAKSNISINNAFYYYQVADSVDIKRIIEFTKEFIRNDFHSCSNSAAYLDVTYSNLIEVIDSPVTDELDRFKIIMNWIQFDPNKRSNYLSDLLKHVRLAYISTDDIFYDILDYQLVINNLEIIKAIRERRKLESTVRIYCIKESDLKRVDIYDAKLEATHAIGKTDVDYSQFQICSSADAIYLSAFKYGRGNKLYRFKDSQWTLLDSMDYNPNVANLSILYAEKDKTIYVSSDSRIHSYNLESKSSFVDYNKIGGYLPRLKRFTGSLVYYRGLIYTTAALSSPDSSYIVQYDPRVEHFRYKRQLPTYCINALCAVFGGKMFILGPNVVHMYDIMKDQCTLIVKFEGDVNFHSLFASQDQLYAIRDEFDVIDVFDLTKRKWTKTIHVK